MALGCKKIICESKIDKIGKNLAWVSCEIYSEQGVVFSSAKFVFYLLKEIEE